MVWIDFNRDNHVHRLMLAQAIRAYTKATGTTLAGLKNGGGNSFRHHLEKAGCATSESQLDRLLRAPSPDERGISYPKIARQVAAFLAGKGHFPPGQDVGESLQMLPLFFDGFAPGAAEMLRHLCGTYTSYQFANLDPSTIIMATLVIEPMAEWNYARITETFDIKQKGRTTLVYEGIAFSDHQQRLTILSREHTLKHPRFYYFEDSDKPNGQAIETLYGTLLGGARLRPRHLSPIAIYRGDHPRPIKPVPVSDMSPLPEYVRRYFARALLPGPENGTPLNNI